jgi:alpha-amylase
MSKYFRDPSVIANFVDNHDNQRFLYLNNNPLLLKSALAFVIGAEGVPITYYVRKHQRDFGVIGD